MLTDAAVMAHLETRGINETKSRTAPKTQLQIAAQWDEARGYPSDESRIAHQRGKRLAPVPTDMMNVVTLKVTIMTLMEAYQDCHDFAQ